MLITTQNPYKISVLLLTYNHEKYIQQALDALFYQLITETIELVIADDASSDSTVEIIKEYEGKDDRFCFKYLNNTKNMGVTKNYQRGFKACSGKYVAVLEGDDYWISPYKLQRQMDFLDNHWECSLCSVNYFIFEEDHCNFYPRSRIGDKHRLISARDLIMDNLVGNFSTCMYRKSALDYLPIRLFEIESYDWIVNICIAQTSMIGFLEQPMSVYRLHSKGVWSKTSALQKLRKQQELIIDYDILTNHVFQMEFELLSNQLKQRIFITKLKKQPVIGILLNLIDILSSKLIKTVRVLIPSKLKFFILNNTP